VNYINYCVDPSRLDIVLYKGSFFSVKGLSVDGRSIFISNKEKKSYIVSVVSVIFLIGNRFVNLNGSSPKINDNDYILMHYHRFNESVATPKIKRFGCVNIDDWSKHIVYSWYPINTNYINIGNFKKIFNCLTYI
jgi:hypothetical protein